MWGGCLVQLRGDGAGQPVVRQQPAPPAAPPRSTPPNRAARGRAGPPRRSARGRCSQLLELLELAEARRDRPAQLVAPQVPAARPLRRVRALSMHLTPTRGYGPSRAPGGGERRRATVPVMAWSGAAKAVAR